MLNCSMADKNIKNISYKINALVLLNDNYWNLSIPRFASN